MGDNLWLPSQSRHFIALWSDQFIILFTLILSSSSVGIISTTAKSTEIFRCEVSNHLQMMVRVFDTGALFVIVEITPKLPPMTGNIDLVTNRIVGTIRWFMRAGFKQLSRISKANGYVIAGKFYSYILKWLTPFLFWQPLTALWCCCFSRYFAPLFILFAFHKSDRR